MAHLKLSNFVRAAVLAIALVVAPMSGVSVGQTDGGGAGGVNTTVRAADDDEGFDWGLLGLLGLLGLAGLRRKDHDRAVHRTTA